MAKNIVTRIKEFKIAYTLNQVQLSTLLGVNKYTLNRWLTGKTTPSPVYERLVEKKLKKYH